MGGETNMDIDINANTLVMVITIVSFIITILYLQFTSQGRELRYNIKIYFQKHLRKYPAIEEFYESYEEIPWQKYIEEAKKKLILLVYYLDTWIGQHKESLKKFFSKPNTKIRLFLSDPNIEENVKNLERIFSYIKKEEEIITKVKNTMVKIFRIAEIVGASQSRVELYYYPYYLNYSAICFDDKILVLSLFEFKRLKEIRSPAIIINLEKSSKINEMWKNDLETLERLSKHVA